MLSSRQAQTRWKIALSKATASARTCNKRHGEDCALKKLLRTPEWVRTSREASESRHERPSTWLIMLKQRDNAKLAFAGSNLGGERKSSRPGKCLDDSLGIADENNGDETKIAAFQEARNIILWALD